MKTSGNVIVLSIAGAAPPRLRQALLKQKIESELVKNLSEVDRLRMKWGAPMLVVCFGEAEDKATALIGKLVKNTSYHALPLLVVGIEADTLKPELSKVFPVVGALNIPVGVSSIVAEIELLWEEYGKRKEKTKKDASTQLDTEVFERSKTNSGAHEQTQKKTLAFDFFERLKELNLLGRTVGGSFLSKTLHSEHYLQGLVAKHPSFLAASEQGMQNADLWIKGHALRAAYMTHTFLTVLNTPEEEVTASTRAALWHALSFKSNRRVGKMLLHRAAKVDYRLKVAAAVRESATIVAADFQAPKESLILGLLSRFLSNEELDVDAKETVHAHAVYAADVIDRGCFSDGFFNPQKGYSMLRDIKAGVFDGISPSVAVVAIKFLSEAIVAAPVKLAMPAAMIRAYRKRRDAGELDEQPATAGEKKVPIGKLAPGMTLSRPLVTLDGKEILEAQLMLDEDLIMRLWQLTAVRPVESAMIKKESARM